MLTGALGYLTSWSKRFVGILEGTAVLVAKDGRVLPDAVRRYCVGEGDIEKSLREADGHVSNIERAHLDADGSISILKRRCS